MMATDWERRDLQRLREANRMLRTEYAKAKARIAQLELDALLERERDRTDVAWLQGKILRQKRELKRLSEAAELRDLWPAGVVKDGDKKPAEGDGRG